ncbi:hypothetical protein [Streptomyces sp. NPDC060001]|uniref:hypothetical protein n=1 Tax=Streptomyces sp. NPDC060001 TaxID=3347032 RepID=UPI0036C13546
MPDDIPAYRAISREYPDGRRIIVSVRDTGTIDPATDEATLDRFEADMDEQRAEPPADPAS